MVSDVKGDVYGLDLAAEIIESSPSSKPLVIGINVW